MYRSLRFRWYQRRRKGAWPPDRAPLFVRPWPSLGEGLATILLEVCCLERGLEAAERRLGWPSRSGKVVLRLALARLALHYGLSRRAVTRWRL